MISNKYWLTGYGLSRMAKLKTKALWIASGDVAGRGLAFLTSLYLAATLGPEYYGLITVAVSVLGYATWFSDLGLLNIGTRETAREPGKRNFRIAEIFRLKLLLGITVLVFAVFAIQFTDIGTVQKQVLNAYLLSVIPYVLLMEWYFSGKQEFGKIALSKILNGAVYLLLVMIFIQSRDDITLVPFMYTAGVLTACILLGIFAWRDRPFRQKPRGLHIYRELLKTGSLLGTGKFFGQMIQLLPPLAIGAFISLTDAGLYGAAFKIVIIAMMIDRVFVNLLLPNLSSLWSRDKKEALKKVDIVYRLVTTGGVLIALFIAVSAEDLITFLYPDEYQGSIVILQLLSVLIGATFINSLFGFGLIATGKDRDYFRATLIGGLSGGVIILLMVYFGNTLSAAAAVGIAEIIITISTCYYFRKTLPVNLLKPLLYSIIPASVLFVAQLYVPLMPVLSALICSVIYVTFILSSGVLSRSQLQWIKEKITA